jgi:hypothetical protein
MKGPRMDGDAQSATRWPPARLADAVVTTGTVRAADGDAERRAAQPDEEQHPPDEPGYGHGV